MLSVLRGFLVEFSGLFSLSHCGKKTWGMPEVGAWAGGASTLLGTFMVPVR